MEGETNAMQGQEAKGQEAQIAEAQGSQTGQGTQGYSVQYSPSWTVGDTGFNTTYYLVPSTTTYTMPRENEKQRTRMLNISLAEYTKFQELDGGLLVKDVKLLAEGTWTDSNVQTPLHYPASTLQKDAENWLNRSLWVRHAGKAPRSITDKVGSVKNPHYVPHERAIMGDLFFHCRTQMSKDASELVRCGEINAVSVEHGGEERFNASTKEYDATALAFYGCALVDMGACEVCKIRHDEKQLDAPANSEAPQVTPEKETPQQRENDTMDDEIKKLLADMDARLKKLETPPAKVEEKKEAEKPQPTLEEVVAKALEPIAMRLTNLEKKPEPKSLQPKDDNKKELAPETRVRSRSMSMGDF